MGGNELLDWASTMVNLHSKTHMIAQQLKKTQTLRHLTWGMLWAVRRDRGAA